MFSCFRMVAPWTFLTLILFFKVTNVSTDIPDTEKNIGNDAVDGEYLESCSMANLLIATRQYKDGGRYAYGLTVDCIFFWFDLLQYETIEKALDYFQNQWDIDDITKLKTLCPVDMFNIRYVSQGKAPYFEIIDLQSGSLQQVEIDKNRRLSFYHFSPSTRIDKNGWKFARSGWTGFHQDLLIHAKPKKNQNIGKMEVKTFVRSTNERVPGGCIMQSFHDHLLFQMVPLVGKEAANLTKFFEKGWPSKDEDKHYAAKYYFFGILSVLVVACISFFGCLGLIVWKLLDYFKMEAKRREIEKFVVECYVEKLEKFTKATQASKKKSKKLNKKKKKISKSRKSVSSYHHRRRYYSDPELPHGSKILPIPDEKDFFASDKKKLEPKHKTTQRAPSKGSNASVCSLRSLTQSVDDSLDWTSKGVPMSKRKQAYKQQKQDKMKDEDEAYKLGMNVSSYRRKRKQQRHGFTEDSTQGTKHQASDNRMGAGTPKAKTPTSSKMHKSRSSTIESKKDQQHATKEPKSGGGNSVQQVKNDVNPYGSMIVPASADPLSNPQKPKKK